MADNSQVTNFSVNGAKHAIIKKAFDGNSDIFRTIMVVTANPHATITSGVIGTLAWDETANDAYINTDVSTTWVKINA